MTTVAMRDVHVDAGMDRELLRRYHAGDVDAFMELYRRYSRPLAAYARMLTHDASRSEDLVQETFLRLMDVDPKTELRPYLHAVLRNLAADLARREEVRSRPLPVSRPASPVEQESVGEALAALPPEQREAVVLKIFGGLTLAEVAEVTAVSEATATSRYRYALEKLARILGGEGDPR
jgi:RNA polymerase sigma-70 factor, ECF subfamily